MDYRYRVLFLVSGVLFVVSWGFLAVHLLNLDFIAALSPSFVPMLAFGAMGILASLTAALLREQSRQIAALRRTLADRTDDVPPGP